MKHVMETYELLNDANIDVPKMAEFLKSRAPTQPHEPVPFMKSPVDMEEMNKHEVDSEMDATLSVDATKGDRIINHKGITITPTLKEGYILRISEELLDLLAWTTGKRPRVTSITTQDITRYGNRLLHMNSIMRPRTATDSPVVGVAVTAETAVPGCETGANHKADVAEAGTFCLEIAKAFTGKKRRFYDQEEFSRIVKLYGRMNFLQTLGGM